MSPVLFTDADNTLWDTDAVYAHAQHGLLTAIARHVDMEITRGPQEALAYLREIDQKIAAQHLKGLRYPPELLALGLRRALKGDEAGAVDLTLLLQEETSDLSAIIEEYVEALRARPHKRKGVSRGLKGVRDLQSPVVVVTEGSKSRCMELLDFHRLSVFVDDVVSLRKSVDAYRSIMNPSKQGLMVGDQADRDILFAGQAGLYTCYFPGNFAPFWAEGIDFAPDFHIESYAEVPAALRTIQSGDARSRRLSKRVAGPRR